MSIITLTTDFGAADHYVAAMKGVILSINPTAIIVDITHSVPPQDVWAGAFALAGAARYFPPGTVHVAIVDPEVGGERRPIALRARPGSSGLRTATAEDHFFVGPDNGVLSLAADLASPFAAVQLTNRAYWRREVSRTFHGRDIFAPVAAHLSSAGPGANLLAALGEALDPPPARLHWPAVAERDGMLIGEVIYIDRYGNLITNLSKRRVASQPSSVEIAGQRIEGIRQTYADAGRGELLALIGSSGLLEITVRDGSAAQALGAKVGDAVIYRRRAAE
ncbi:MAG: SAM-dependent chlorinase/fluorinase [Chloroflexi bacterium]|nr:SAM-dependent chlorinase/fluorinase [Chloroflexota bacterium]